MEIIESMEAISINDIKNTLHHVSRVLNKIEFVELAQRFDINLNLRDRYDILINIVIENIIKNEKYMELYYEIVKNAFTPELDVLDGFFMAYDSENMKFNIDKFKNELKAFNDNKGSIEIINFNDRIIKLIICKNKDKYFYDINSKISKIFNEEIKCNVEIYVNNSIIYFQTPNSTIFNSLKTVLQLFFNIYFDDPAIKLTMPKFASKLSTINDLDPSFKMFNMIDPATIKILDIIFELENKEYGFTGFKASDLKFNHEESTKFDLDSRINSIDISGDNLLYHKEIKDKILNKRVIMNMELTIEFNEKVDEKNQNKHFIDIVMKNNDNKYYRIFVRENSTVKNSICKKAYSALKNLFITSYSNKELKNKDKIINLLRYNNEK